MRTLTDTDGFPGILSAMTVAGILVSCAWLLTTL